jgi:hypothetical protein
MTTLSASPLRILRCDAVKIRNQSMLSSRSEAGKAPRSRTHTLFGLVQLIAW